MRLYYTTTPRRLITSLWRKLFNLMRYSWNFRQQIRSVRSSCINRAIDSEKTMSTHFMTTNEQNLCFTKPINVLYKADRQRSRRQNISFLISISAVILKLMVKITSIFGPYTLLRIAWHDIFLLSDHFPVSWNLYIPCDLSESEE